MLKPSPELPPEYAVTPATPTPIFDHAWIARHIPHQGTMCLLDHVVECDAGHIVCLATTHRNTDHPLRFRDQLSAVVAIEYAAQAMAAHGAALARREQAPAVGFLTAVRSVRFGVDRIDTLDAPLRCEATRLSGDARNILYAFKVSAGSTLVAEGRAAVMLDADDSLGIGGRPDSPESASEPRSLDTHARPSPRSRDD
ncbi:MAG TPA: hydroxymyristoyl-ACP dehydratase [Pararobbsia sp.]|nr:hydroxymyristoyl-ACP dehydratase [Pararobbsia sp.]